MPESPSLVLSLPSVPTATIALTTTPYTTFGASSAGVYSINEQLGHIVLSGAGSVYVTNNSRLIIISGSSIGGGTTGAVTQGQLESTGTILNLKIDSLSGWTSNTLTQTGATLIGLINGLNAGGVTSVNSATGAILLTGAGTITITRDGNAFTISGMVSGGGAGDVTFSQLAATGSYLEGLINAQSGFNSTTYATKVNLATTGSNLFTRDISISGGLESRIAATGQIAWITADNNGRNLSGNLTQTGILLNARITTVEADITANANNLSGRLTQTGSQLYSMAAAISGNLTQTGVSLGSRIGTVESNTLANATNLSGRLAATGSQLYSMAAAISGNLIQTGVTLGNQINIVSTNATANATNLSGNLTQTGVALIAADLSLSGAFGLRLTNTGINLASLVASTGQAVWIATQNNGLNLSGSLTASGQRLTALTVTGSSILNTANLVGLGGTLVIHSGANVYISGSAGGGGVSASQLESTGQQAWTAANNNARNLSGDLTQTGSILIGLISAASAGVSSINGASGVVTVEGAGNVSVVTNGQTITVSGNTGAYAGFASKIELTASGQTLGVRIDTTDANTLANAVNLSGRLAATGSQLYSMATAISGNLTQTGVSLGSRIDGLTSDSTANASNLSGRLALTGSQLYSFAATISGNLTQTGVSLGSRIATVETNTAANATNLSGRLAATGSQLFSFASAVSGDLIQTGVTLGNQINTVVTNTAANATNLSGRLAATGSQLFSMASAISGNLIATGVSLGLRIDTVATNTQNNATNLSGSLTQTGVSLGSRIDTLTTNVAANASNLSGALTATGQILDVRTSSISGNLIQTGVNLGSRIDTVATNGTANATNLSGRLAVTGSQLFSYSSSLSGNLIQTGVALGSQITTVATNTAANASNLSGNLTATGASLGIRIDGIITTATAISGNLIQTGVSLGSRIDTLTTNVTANANNLSGRLTATGQLLSAVSITGSAIINNPVFTGIGGTLVIFSGNNTVLISGGAGGGVSASQLEATGQAAWIAADNNARNLSGNLTTTGAVLWQRDLDISGVLASQIGAANAGVTSVNGLTGVVTINGVGQATVTTVGSTITVSGITPSSGILSPAFVQASGTHVTLSVSPLKASQNLELLATGINTVLTITGMFNGANGVVLVTKLYEGTGSITLQSDSKIINNLSSNIVTLSTGSGVWDALSFICDNNRPYWAVSTLSGSAGGGVGDVTSAQLASTGQQAWTAADNNARNLSGNLTLTGVSLGSRIDTLTTNLTQTGISLIERDVLISGALVTGMSPAFISISGTAITIPISRSKASQQYKLLATGNNTTLTVTNSYDGANGIIIVDKSFEGTGALILPAGAVVINGGGINAIPYSTGIGYDAFSFIYDDVRSYWAVSSLSGSSSSAGAPTQGGTGTLVSITGSSNLINTIVTGVGSVTVSLIGTTTIISGSSAVGGGAGNSSNQQILVNANNQISGSTDFTWDNPAKSLNIGQATILSDNPLAIAGSGGFLQINIQNKSNLSGASSDIVATANNGTDTSNYVNLGINSSTYNQTGYSNVGPNDSYLYSNGGNLVIGTQTPNKLLKLHVGGTTSGNHVITITQSGLNLETGDAIQFGNSLRLDSESYAGKEVISIMQSGSRSAGYIVGPALWSKQFTAILPATTTSQTILGNTLANAAGTVSTVSNEVFGQFTNYITAAPAGSAAGTSVTTAYYLRGTITGRNGFFFTCQFALTDGTTPTNAYGQPSGSRIFIGMTDQSALNTVATNDPGGNRVGLHYVWASGGSQANRFQTNWFISTKNNTTQFTGDMGVAMMSGYYRFSLYCPPFNAQNTGIYWQLDDLLRGSGVVGIVRDNLPIGTTALRPAAVICTMSGIKNLKTNNVYVETAG